MFQQLTADSGPVGLTFRTRSGTEVWCFEAPDLDQLNPAQFYVWKNLNQNWNQSNLFFRTGPAEYQVILYVPISMCLCHFLGTFTLGAGTQRSNWVNTEKNNNTPPALASNNVVFIIHKPHA